MKYLKYNKLRKYITGEDHVLDLGGTPASNIINVDVKRSNVTL